MRRRAAPRRSTRPSVEQAIRADIVRQGGALQSITCPVGIKAKQGTTFDCTIVLSDGSSAVAHVTMTTAGPVRLHDREDAVAASVVGGGGFVQLRETRRAIGRSRDRGARAFGPVRSSRG